IVAEGRGNLYQLGLRHVPNNFDIQEGDLLVSSGLGKRFPNGYPVAVVESIKPDKSSPWAEVIAKPLAELNRNRHVLLVFEEAPQLKSNADSTSPAPLSTAAASSSSASSSTSASSSGHSSSSSSSSSAGKPSRPAQRARTDVATTPANPAPHPSGNGASAIPAAASPVKPAGVGQ
ncbi:MAG: rod shape-determining protein MreC, partial [Sphingobacteriales bacterium]